MTCPSCGGEGFVVVAEHGCNSDRECSELCPVPVQHPCPDCTSARRGAVDCPSCTGNVDAALCRLCVAEMYDDPPPEHDWTGGYSRADLAFGGNW